MKKLTSPLSGILLFFFSSSLLLSPVPAAALRVEQQREVSGRPQFAAGAEEESPVAWAGALYPNTHEPATVRGRGSRLTAYFSFRPAQQELDRVLLQTVHEGHHSLEKVVAPLREEIRRTVEPRLLVRGTLSDRNGWYEPVVPFGTHVTDVYRDGTLRAGILLGGEVFRRLPAGDYFFDLEVSLDKGKTWRGLDHRGAFHFESANRKEEAPGSLSGAAKPSLTRRFSVLPEPADPEQRVRKLLESLTRGPRDFTAVLIGPEALAGSAGLPAIAPLLIEVKNALPSSDWKPVQERVIAYTEDPVLSALLREAGYRAPSDRASLEAALARMVSGRGLAFYMAGGDWLMRGEISGVTRSVQLTRENYLSQLAGLLEAVGYLRPEPERLRELPRDLSDLASSV